MPVYEYRCNTCHHIYSELKKMGDSNCPPCPQCHSHNTEKIISLVSTIRGKSSCSGCSGKNCSHCKLIHYFKKKITYFMQHYCNVSTILKYFLLIMVRMIAPQLTVQVIIGIK